MSRFSLRNLHEHSVWQVLASYTIASWIILQVTETVASLVGLPLWMGRAVIITLLMGLPVLLATAVIKLIPGSRAVVSWPGRVFTWKNAVLGGVAAFTLLALGTGTYLGMRAAGIGPVGTLFATGTLDAADPVLLAEFENTTDDPELSAVVTEIFRIDLQRSTAITLAEPERVAQAMTRMGLESEAQLSPQRARELALREGIKAVIAGQIANVGSTLVVSARVVAAEDGSDLVALRETADDDSELIDAVDRLSSRLRERVGESLRELQTSEPLADVTTSSIEALRFYTQGDRAEEAGETERALGLMEEAVRIDPEFASAHRAIAVILGNRFEQNSRMREAATRAYEHRDRLPPRERYMTTAYYHLQVEGDLQQAATAYRTLLELIPDDRSALNNLGVIYAMQHDYERGDQTQLRVFELDSAALSYKNLVVSALQLGQMDSARARLDRFESAYPGHPAVREMQAEVAYSAWDWERAGAAHDTLLMENPDDPYVAHKVHEERVHRAYMRGRVQEAERHLERADAVIAERGLTAAAFALHARLAAADLLIRDDPEAARRRFAHALRRFEPDSLPVYDRPYLDIVRYHTLAGDFETAGRYVSEMESDEAFRVIPSLKIQRDFSASFLALEEGRLDDAIDILRRATAGNQCWWCAYPWLGRAFDRASLPDSAITYYQGYVDSRNRISAIDTSQLPIVLLRLAELYEEQGQAGLALEHYSRFVELWDQADPELQGSVRAAQQRIERLAGEGSTG